MLITRSSTHWGCMFKLLLNAGLGPFAMYISLNPHIIACVAGFLFEFAFLSLAFLSAVLSCPPPCQPDSHSAVYGWVKYLSIFGKASTLAIGRV